MYIYIYSTTVASNSAVWYYTLQKGLTYSVGWKINKQKMFLFSFSTWRPVSIVNNIFAIRLRVILASPLFYLTVTLLHKG